MGQLSSFKFEELVVYQKAIDFVDRIYLLTKRLTASKKGANLGVC